MPDDHRDGLSDSGATEGNEDVDVAENAPTISDTNVEVAVDFVNYAGASDEDVEDEEVLADAETSDKDDGDDDGTAVIDMLPYEIDRSGFQSAATISHPATNFHKLDENSHKSHDLPIVPNINGNVPSVESNDPDPSYVLSCLKAKKFPTLVNMLHHETERPKEERILIAKAILEKHREATVGPKRKTKRPCKPYPSNALEMKMLLYGPKRTSNKTRIREDDLRRWRVISGHKLVVEIDPRDPHRNNIVPGLFMRGFDDISISRYIDPEGGFNAGSPDKALDTALARMTELRNHTYWPNRSKTPFISMTTHADLIAHFMERFEKRTAKNGLIGEKFPGQVVIINGFAQIAAGFPLLRIKDEMARYNVLSLYGPHSEYGYKSFYENEWIAPYCVPKCAIVKAYFWRDIVSWMKKNNASIWDWYLQVAAADFAAHEKERQDKIKKSAETKKRPSADDLEATDATHDSGSAAHVGQDTIPEQETFPNPPEQRWVLYEPFSDVSK